MRNSVGKNTGGYSNRNMETFFRQCRTDFPLIPYGVANTANLLIKYGEFADQTRRICLPNTASLLTKYGEFALWLDADGESNPNQSLQHWLPGAAARGHSCPASTISTTRSVRRSLPFGSYFFVSDAPKAHANAW